MLLSDGNISISLEKYFENEISHINSGLEDIKRLINERNLRVFQLEEINRDLDVRVHDIEVEIRFVKWILGIVAAITVTIATAYILGVLGL